MRWPFRRSSPNPAPSGASSGSPSAGSGQWRQMPALQRISADLGPVAPLDRFADSLATHQDPRFLAPLAHAVTPEAPSGQVAGLATPAAGADLPPVQRFARPSDASTTIQRSVSVTPAPPSRPVTLPPIDTRPIPSLPEIVVAPAPSDTPSPAGMSDLPAVQRAATSPGPVQPGVDTPTLGPSTAPVPTTDSTDSGADPVADTATVTSECTTDLPVVSRTIAPDSSPKPRADTAPSVPTIGAPDQTARPAGGQTGDATST